MELSKSQTINRALAHYGIRTYLDVLEHTPRTYEDMNPTENEVMILDKSRVVFYGYITRFPTLSHFARVSLVRFGFRTLAGNEFNIEAYNRPYLVKILNSGVKYVLVGVFDQKKHKVNLVNISKYNAVSHTEAKPVYSLPSEVDQLTYRRLVDRAFSYYRENNYEIKDVVPAYFMKKYRLLPRKEALELLHHPKDFKDVHAGLRVLKYEECLKFTLKTELIREENKKLEKNKKQHINTKLVDEFIKTLPYKLTKSQDEALIEILFDMNKTSLMYRLLQGDVGSGKTLVAALALYGNYLRNDQGALMAPTDALARQHYVTLCNLFKDTKMKIALLVGQTPYKEKKAIELGLINHEIDIVVGTHALFSKSVEYSSLGLAVIDEQHRFGVNQRLLLASKGSHADLLLMSATPIPRTLALTIYGDLDVSTLKEFPFDNKQVNTLITSSNDQKIDELINDSLAHHQQVYIIAPLIMDDLTADKVTVETLFARYLLKYPGKVALLHGKLSQEEKLYALESFKKNQYPIIISTTVIEVGLDVKTANLMIIYDASSFGLASLHQLRGRIGRDGKKANCVLIYDGSEESERDKLEVLVRSNDGFYIANEDLKRRGPGELGGYRQSGLPSFNFVNLIDDFKMFTCAREDSKFILLHRLEPGFRRLLKEANEEINNDKFTNV
ncbi:MAG: ATP-dependent DNA helicase RecG [Bacilli bacterium]|nr:ATP-dependent DNA helicase RecG [Bacilli bacterium]